MKFKYKKGVLGGTFDHLHAGHRDLLDGAFKLTEKIEIGLTTEKLYQHKFLPHLIEPFSVRERKLNEYLDENNLLERSKIIPLRDIYGTTLETEDFEAIFVTQNTLPNARIINEERNRRGIHQIDVITIPLRKDEIGEVITSEKIRMGQIDRGGKVFFQLFEGKDELILPKHLREEMREPVGKVVNDVQDIKTRISESQLLISVGDIVSKSLTDIECVPDIQIIDFKSRRHELDEEIHVKNSDSDGYKKYKNKAGSIQKEVVQAYKETIESIIENKEKKIIVIDGEEDLLALPSILFAPINSLVCYGHFDLNAVILIEANEKNKEIVYNLLKQFN